MGPAKYRRVWRIGRVHLSKVLQNLRLVDAERLHTFVHLFIHWGADGC